MSSPKREYVKRNLSLIWRSLKYIHSVSPNFIFFSIITNVFSALSPYVNIYMAAFILNELTGKRDPKLLLYLVAATILLNFTITLISRAFGRFMRVRIFQFWQDFGMVLNLAVASFDYNAMENPDTHKKINYYQELLIEIGGGPGQMTNFLYKTVYAIVNIIMSTAIIIEITAKGFFVRSKEWYLSWPISLIALILIAIIAVYRIISNVKTTKKSQDSVEDNLVYSRIMKYYNGDYLSNYHTGKDIRIYDQEDIILGGLREERSSAERVMLKITGNNRFASLVSGLTEGAENIIVTIIVGLRAISGFIGVGEVAKAISGVSGLINGISSLASAVAQMFVNNKCMEAFFAIIDTPNKMYQGSLRVPRISGAYGEYEIEFRNVSFKYPQSDRYVLKDVSLKIRAGKKIAVVGMNGSGKTTFIKLLCRLYDPTQGEILLNGINIRDYDYDEYLSLFSVVFQDFNLFAVTLGQNITGKTEYDSSSVLSCIEKVGLGKRYEEMSDGLDTYLYKNFDERGVEISGGEAQKVALARALYRDAPFIILDEPTSALDPVAEYDIYTKFNTIVGNKTALYISHRLSSCRFCDDIAVFDEGALVQRGTHSELVNADGKYSELWYAQSRYYTEDKSGEAVVVG